MNVDRLVYDLSYYLRKDPLEPGTTKEVIIDTPDGSWQVYTVYFDKGRDAVIIDVLAVDDGDG